MPTRRRVPADRTYTPALVENIRRRYEETDEPVATMASDLQIAPFSLRRLARNRNWIRRVKRPPRDLSPALRLLEEARAAAAGAVVGGEAMPGLTLPPRSGGEGRRAPEGASRGAGSLPDGEAPDGVAPPTPDPSPPFALLTGGGETAALEQEPLGETEALEQEPLGAAGEPPSVAAAGGAQSFAASRLSTIERLERAVLAELATIETMRAQLGVMPQTPRDAERTVRTLGLLSQTLQHLQRLRAASAGAAAQARGGPDRDDDDMPRDIDEFRRDLARRIDAFVASRADAGGASGDADAAPLDGAG